MGKHYSEDQVRRFEPGASGLGADQFLQDRGYKVILGGGSQARVIKPRSKKVTKMPHWKLIDLLDEERVKLGREPIVKRKGKRG
jgi:hypothetical protein